MSRLFYVNPRAGVGETFGVFLDREMALSALRRHLRNPDTHTIYRTPCGWVVNVRGY